jgi:hypothetical protein
MESLHVTYQAFFHSFLGMLLRQAQLTKFLLARKWQNVIMNEFLLAASSFDSSVYEQTLDFLLEAFRQVASSGRAGSIGEAFLNLGRWLETLYLNRPSNIVQEKDVCYR